MKEEYKEELKKFMALHDFDEESYLLGVKHGAGMLSLENVPHIIIYYIANAALELANMFQESGLSEEDFKLFGMEDVRRIALNNEKEDKKKRANNEAQADTEENT